MVNEKSIETLAVTVTTIAVLSRLATRIQNPNSTGRSAAMDHKVASTLMKRLNKHLVSKE